MNKTKLHILVFGAHPDDCDIKTGGLAALYAQAGHRVKFVSHTNGATGHQAIGGVELALRRYEEAQAAARILGIEYQVLDNHNGELEPTIPFRKEVIRIMREFEPDLVITHRPNDYHPDHRYSSILVQDASYIVSVPNMCPLTRPLSVRPVMMHMSDFFQKPLPFSPDVVVDIDAVAALKIDALHCHVSQMYEWLPYADGEAGNVPEKDADRKAWMAERRLGVCAKLADKYRDTLIELYGADHGGKVHYAEAFEVCEYGAALTDERRARLFPFVNKG